MLAKRVIVCLDCDLELPKGRVVKGIKFKKIRYAGLPWKLAEKYFKDGADEIVFLDITASDHKRTTMVEVVEKTCQNVFVPITVGGGIRSLEDAKKVFLAGADKIAINTAAIKNPKLISQLSNTFGSQAVVVAIDAKRRNTQGRQWFECFIYGGKEPTGWDAINWAKKAEKLGAGEIILTSIDRDGTKKGFDLALTKKIVEVVSIPVIASGGAGRKEHFALALQKGKADAVLAAGLFHFGELEIPDVKKYLKKEHIYVR